MRVFRGNFREHIDFGPHAGYTRRLAFVRQHASRRRRRLVVASGEGHENKRRAPRLFRVSHFSAAACNTPALAASLAALVMQSLLSVVLRPISSLQKDSRRWLSSKAANNAAARAFLLFFARRALELANRLFSWLQPSLAHPQLRAATARNYTRDLFLLKKLRIIAPRNLRSSIGCNSRYKTPKSKMCTKI